MSLNPNQFEIESRILIQLNLEFEVEPRIFIHLNPSSNQDFYPILSEVIRGKIKNIIVLNPKQSDSKTRILIQFNMKSRKKFLSDSIRIKSRANHNFIRLILNQSDVEPKFLSY